MRSVKSVCMADSQFVQQKQTKPKVKTSVSQIVQWLQNLYMFLDFFFTIYKHFSNLVKFRLWFKSEMKYKNVKIALKHFKQ